MRKCSMMQRHNLWPPEGRMGILLEMEEILSGLEACNCFIEKLEEEMLPYLGQIPYSDLLLSVKGIGVITVGRSDRRSRRLSSISYPPGSDEIGGLESL